MLFFYILFNSAFAGDAVFSKNYPGWPAWDKKCHALSLKYKKHFPTRKIDPFCSLPPKTNPEGVDFNEVSERHLHGLLAELFYAKRNDQRRSAMTLLYSYSCETKIICDEFKNILDREIRRDFLKLSQKDPLFFKNIKELRDRVSK